MSNTNPIPIGPWACDAVSEIGLRCDLQPDHGGEMHSGGNPRKWWTFDGQMVDFARAALSGVKPQ